jgi:hypothetical protein
MLLPLKRHSLAGVFAIRDSPHVAGIRASDQRSTQAQVHLLRRTRGTSRADMLTRFSIIFDAFWSRSAKLMIATRM